jgi:hypothetical protein
MRACGVCMHECISEFLISDACVSVKLKEGLFY